VAKRTIVCDRLKGLETDHTDCRFSAPAFATGVLVRGLDVFGEDEPIGWVMEFHCTLCNENYTAYLAIFHDQIRDALIENGIIPPSSKVGPNY